MNAFHPLGELIRSVEDSKGWSLREIARRIERSGRTFSPGYAANLKNNPLASISTRRSVLSQSGWTCPSAW